MKWIVKALLVFSITFLVFVDMSLSFAFCPFPQPRIRSLFTQSDVAFVGTVVSQRGTDENGKPVTDVENDSPDEIYYKVKVTELFRGPDSEFIEVCEGNDSARMGLDIGQTYLLLIPKNKAGLLEGSCYDAVSSSDINYLKDLKETRRVEEAIKKSEPADILGFVSSGRNQDGTDGMKGVRFLVTGNGISEQVVSDKKGWFHVLVPAGNYQIKPIDSRLNLVTSDYSTDDPNNIHVLPAGGAEIYFMVNPQNEIFR